MNGKQEDAIKFEGEEAGAGYASPTLDLIASAMLVLLSVVVMVASFTLPAPGGVLTAPGLLPFLIAGSLLLMALVLGATALQRRSFGWASEAGGERDMPETMAALLLVVTVGVYIAALQFLVFQHHIEIAGIHYTLSAFEPVTIVVLAAIIHVAWRGPLWIITVVSVGWTAFLSVVFQKVFLIPLPGGF